jgi:hypothetical protein
MIIKKAQNSLKWRVLNSVLLAEVLFISGVDLNFVAVQ